MSATGIELVLSLFPGIGLLDMAFEEEGFCVVRGPDLLWGGDVRNFHPPAGRFDGVIGGPPCQAFSQLNVAGRAGYQALAPNLIPEFERCVLEARPRWFLMENVPPAPLPDVTGYVVSSRLLNQRWLEGATPQNRVRRFSLGSTDALSFRPAMAALEPIDKAPCFTANATQWNSKTGKSRSVRTRFELRRGLVLQGLSEDYLDHAPFTVEGAIRVVGNGVPLPMGRAVARAVRESVRGPQPKTEEVA
jgi:DNA (cytosine-5)-methyltransferase 1